MKTIIYTIIILFSFTQLTAQEISSTESDKITCEVVKNSTKTDFYKTLIATNNFDITIKKNDKVVVKTKNEFYESLMIKNGFTIDSNKNTRLTNNNNNSKKHNSKSQISGLLL